MKHLYLHIPFCHRRCSYCSFNTYANMEDRIAAYVAALCQEISWRAADYPPPAAPQANQTLPELQQPVTRADLMPTIFLGGGTPTMLSIGQLDQILQATERLIARGSAEITIEANPGTVISQHYLRELRQLGINRISMGVQSLHDPTLRMLGRIHTAQEAYTSFVEAREAGFERINLDFMFGLPGQTIAAWEQALREITSWGADHFSLYSLILEEGTPLHAQVTGKRLHLPDDDDTATMYELAIEQFAAAGYQQYEISNWASGTQRHNPHQLPPQACHHNLAYWLNADYLACGAGAHGHHYPQRYHDTLGVDQYIQQVQAGQLPTAEIVPLTSNDLYAETMFMGLRLNIGVAYAHFRERCGVEMEDIYRTTLDQLEEVGLISRDALGVRLTDRGRMLGNQVFAEFAN